jgi:hypothetical protein
MQDAYETLFDCYETPFDESQGSVAVLDAHLDPVGARVDRIDAITDEMKARLGRLEATLDRNDARLTRIERTFRRLMICSLVWMTVLTAVFVYVVGSDR